MIEVVFLGTSASAPSVHRGLPSTVVIYGQHRLLIDAGEGTQRQVLRCGLGFRRLNTVLLTHGHLDHVLGLGGLASTYARWDPAARISVYGGKWALRRVRDLMDVVIRGPEPQLELKYHSLAPGPVLTAGDMEVVAFPVQHRGKGNFGFLFQVGSRRPFLVDKATALGVPEGPERRLLVQGETVTLSGGLTVRPDDVLGPAIRGPKLVYIGDAARVDDLVTVAKGADALVCESTFLWPDRETARQFGHLTAREAAELAREAEVGQLLLTHISRRYGARQVLDEATQVFENTAVAEDFDRYEVLRGEVRGAPKRP
jgi:ribonuclease Z